jgi:hypothetical protein
MTAIAIIIAGALIADAIMFVHGYKGFFYCAKTEQEKELRRKWFKDRNMEWNEKN